LSHPPIGAVRHSFTEGERHWGESPQSNSPDRLSLGRRDEKTTDVMK